MLTKLILFSVTLLMLLGTSTAIAGDSNDLSDWGIKRIAVVDGGGAVYSRQLGSFFSPTSILVVDSGKSGRRHLVDGDTPAWSPDGQRLAYSAKGQSGTAQIFVVNFDGSGRKQLTDVKTGAIAPDWSPDGQRIAFTASGTRTHQPVIAVIGENGENLTGLMEGYDARWSPDGKQLVFCRSGSIWIANADGSGEKKVTDERNPVPQPTWYPDGGSILFTSTREHNWSSIFRTNKDGSGLQKILSDKRFEYGSPVISPDGKWLVVDGFLKLDPSASSGDQSVFLIDLATDKEKRLTSGSDPRVVWAIK
jgi:Tol biopolymer transport system component